MTGAVARWVGKEAGGASLVGRSGDPTGDGDIIGVAIGDGDVIGDDATRVERVLILIAPPCTPTPPASAAPAPNPAAAAAVDVVLDGGSAATVWFGENDIFAWVNPPPAPLPLPAPPLEPLLPLPLLIQLAAIPSAVADDDTWALPPSRAPEFLTGVVVAYEPIRGGALFSIDDRCARATAKSDRVSKNGSLSADEDADADSAVEAVDVEPLAPAPAGVPPAPEPAPPPTPTIVPHRLSPALRPSLSRTLGSAPCLLDTVSVSQ